MSSASSRGWRPGHVALGLSLALLAHAAFSAVHFAALAAGRFGEAARALRVLPRDVLAELALALALALAAALLFSEAMLPLDAGVEAPLNSLHRLLAPRPDLSPAAPLGLERPGAAEAVAGAKKLLDEVLRERRVRAKAIELEAAAERAEAAGGASAAGSGRRPAPAVAAEEEDEEDEVLEDEEEDGGEGKGRHADGEDVD